MRRVARPANTTATHMFESDHVPLLCLDRKLPHDQASKHGGTQSIGSDRGPQSEVRDIVREWETHSHSPPPDSHCEDGHEGRYRGGGSEVARAAAVLGGQGVRCTAQGGAMLKLQLLSFVV